MNESGQQFNPEQFLSHQSKPPIPTHDAEILDPLFENIEFGETFESMHQEIVADADKFFGDEYLENLKKLHPQERLRIMTDVSYKVYTSADDFEKYFKIFPEDALLVIETVLSNISFGDAPGSTIYLLGCKVLESAAKTIPGYWEELLTYAKQDMRNRQGYQLPNYLGVSNRSRLAREHLVGDYKSIPGKYLLENYGEEITNLTIEYLKEVEELSNGFHPGLVDPFSELLNQDAIKNLAPKQKTILLEYLISDCNNAIIYHEVFDSNFGEPNLYGEISGKEEKYGYNGTRGLHSILMQTEHGHKAFSYDQYSDFSPNEGAFASGEPTDESGYEKTIESTISELRKALLEANQEERQQGVGFLIDFWNKNRDPAYGPALSKAASELDPQFTTSKILETLPGTSEQDQRRLLSLLYRLELGKIGISEEGVEYLGRKFDLGDYNSSNNFVQRITADGKIGIFNEERQLSGFVQLEANDFSEQENSIRKEVFSITKDILFYAKADESPAENEQKTKILELFCQHYFDTFIGTFDEKSSLRFNNLNLKEQGWALLYLDRADEPGQDKFFDFANKFGENGVQSLIAMEYGADFGQKIIEMTESLNPQEAEQFFGHFSSLIKATENLGEQMASIVPKENPFINPQYLSAQVTEALLRKNKDFITAALDRDKADIKLNEIIQSMEELIFVVNEISDSLSNESKYTTDSISQDAGFKTFTLEQKELKYKINITLRPEESENIVPNKVTGQNEKRIIDPGIRITFVWPNKKKFGLRLDLDPHYKDDQFKNGRLSLDVGNRDSKIAEILDKIAPEAGGHHNTQSFSPELSRPEIFKSICLAFENKLSSLPPTQQ